MKKRIVSLLLIAVMVAFAMLSLSSCGLFNTDGASEKVSIYDIVNSSSATSITTSVDYKTESGDEFTGWYVVEREGNNMIVDYSFDRYATIDESIGLDEPKRIVTEANKIYYNDGKYYYEDDETKTPWLGSPLGIDFKLNIDKSKLLSEYAPNPNQCYITIAADECVNMLGIDLKAVENVSVIINTNGVQLAELEITYTTESGSQVTLLSTYGYGEITLDFGDYFEEEAGE